MHQNTNTSAKHGNSNDWLLKRFILVITTFFLSLIVLFLLKSHKRALHVTNHGTTFIIRDMNIPLSSKERFFESARINDTKSINFIIVGSQNKPETERVARSKVPGIQLHFSDTMNNALATVTSAFVAIFSMSDQLINSYFTQMSKKIATVPEIALLCPYEYIRKSGTNRLFMRKEHFISGILFDNPFTSGCIFSRHFQKYHNIRFRPEFGNYTEYDFWSQFIAKDGKVAFNPVPLVIVDNVEQGTHFYYETPQQQRDAISKTLINNFHISSNATKCDVLTQAKKHSELILLLRDLEEYTKAYCRKKHHEAKWSIIHLAMATDNNYVIPTIAAITSALEHAAAKTFYNIFILHGNELYIESKKQIEYLKNKYNCNITFIDMLDKMSTVPTDERIPVSAYYRLLLPSILPNVKKAIWLDGDVIVLEDLEKMYTLPMDDLYIRGQLDNKPSFADKFGIKNDHYLCSGVLLMNLEEMRKDNLVHFYLSFIKHFGDELVQHDQTVINVIGYTKTGILPARYGVFNGITSPRKLYKFLNSLRTSEKYTRSEYKAAQQRPAIVHFVDKPWKRKCRHSSLWWDNLKHTEFYEHACMTLPYTECAEETFIGSNSTSLFVEKRQRRTRQRKRRY